MSIGDTPLASYSYDAAGRVSGINNVSFGYLANSNLLSTVTRPNNVNTTWSYEANRNLVTGVENKLNSADGFPETPSKKTEDRIYTL